MSKRKSKRHVVPRLANHAPGRPTVDLSLGYEIMSWMVRISLWLAIAGCVMVVLSGCSKTGYENDRKPEGNPVIDTGRAMYRYHDKEHNVVCYGAVWTEGFDCIQLKDK